jgi:ferrous iron transport protein A
MPTNAVDTREDKALLSLAEAGVGRDFQIERIEGPGCEQLRRLGFCETLSVRKLTDGRNLVCSVCGTRLALSSELAEQVKVRPVAAA